LSSPKTNQFYYTESDKMNSTQNPIYHTSVEQKRHAQDVAKRQRMGKQMPKLREMLREVKAIVLPLRIPYTIYYNPNRSTASVL